MLQGTLDLMVLKTLAVMGPQHGYGIARRIEQISDDALHLNEGTGAVTSVPSGRTARHRTSTVGSPGSRAPRLHRPGTGARSDCLLSPRGR